MIVFWKKCNNFPNNKISREMFYRLRHRRARIGRKSFEQCDFFERVKTSRAWHSLNYLRLQPFRSSTTFLPQYLARILNGPVIRVDRQFANFHFIPPPNLVLEFCSSMRSTQWFLFSVPWAEYTFHLDPQTFHSYTWIFLWRETHTRHVQDTSSFSLINSNSFYFYFCKHVK